jgi:Undecaprenyl-phosphate glucose phosphotransferase
VTEIASQPAVTRPELAAREAASADERTHFAGVGGLSASKAARIRLGLVAEPVVLATAATDFALVLITTALAFACFPRPAEASFSPAWYLLPAALCAVFSVAIVGRLGGYRPETLARQTAQVALASAPVLSVSFSGAVAWAATGRLPAVPIIAWFVAAPAALLAGRALVAGLASRSLQNGALARRVVVVGAGAEGRRVVAKFLQSRSEAVVLAVFDDRTGPLPRLLEGRPVLGTTDDLLRYARRQSIDQIVVALPLEAEKELRTTLDKLKVIPADLRVSVDPLVEKLSALGVGRVAGIPVLEIAARPLREGAALCKWLEDKVIGALLLLFFAPLLAIVAALIKLDSRGPVFFSQDRFGFNNNVIRVLKFRTMYVDRGDRSGAERTVPNDPRVTRMGRFLRQWSLDELPQLVNVLRGDMSLVGPRPHAIAMRAGDRLYHEAIPRYAYRHRVKPGLTGWAQVNGFRGQVDTFEKAYGRIECDLYYIENWSVWLDLRIILMTIGLLLSRVNAY